MILVLLALLIPALFGLASLATDLAQARGAQSAMQAAVDPAARECVRWQHVVDDVDRRGASARAVRRAFDDDLLSTAADPWHHGAGGDVRTEDGLTSLAAARTIEIADPPVYKPAPQVNLANAPHGDIVVGRFTWEPGFDAGGRLFRETSDYSRLDFVPDVDGAAVAVRLRRTADDLDRQPGVSSAGEPVALLWGSGALVDGATRRRGLEVRATAIAEPRPALAVGGARPDLRLPAPGSVTGAPWSALTDAAGTLPTPGATPFVLTVAFWNANEAALDVDASGTMRDADTGAYAGTFVARRGWQVGEEPGGHVASASTVLSSEIYVPLTDGPEGAQVVVGFGLATTLSQGGDRLVLQRHRGAVAPFNASAVPRAPRTASTAVIDGALQAPVVVR